MKKITDLKEGDLLTVEATAKLFGLSKGLLYKWHSQAKAEPDKYPRGVKFGGHLFFLKSSIIDRLNKQLSQAS
jgi:predicted DNA-binding transcriptional regulator AlpA